MHPKQGEGQPLPFTPKEKGQERREAKGVATASVGRDTPTSPTVVTSRQTTRTARIVFEGCPPSPQHTDTHLPPHWLSSCSSPSDPAPDPSSTPATLLPQGKGKVRDPHRHTCRNPIPPQPPQSSHATLSTPWTDPVVPHPVSSLWQAASSGLLWPPSHTKIPILRNCRVLEARQS